MAKASPQQFTFSGGELSPLMLGRQDSERYRRGVARCRDAVPLVQGPWTRRPGSVHVHSAKFPDRKARLVPFVFSAGDAFPIEVGHEYFRFFIGGGILTQPPQAVSAAQGMPATFQATDHGFVDGTRVLFQASGPLADDRLAGVEGIVRNPTADTFQLERVATGDLVALTFETGGALAEDMVVAEIFELPSPYREEDLAELRYLQSADVMFFLHPNYAPKQLRRTGPLQWELTTFPLNDGPYGPISERDNTLTLDGLGVTPQAIFSNTNGINDGLGWLPTDVGRLLRVLDVEAEWTWYVVTEIIEPTRVRLERFGQEPANIIIDLFRVGLWSDTTGWPVTGAFHEDRLILAGAPTAPMRLDGSRTGRYDDFSPTDPDGAVADDHAVSAALSSGQINDIQWLSPDQKGLLVGTQGGEWLVSPSALNEALSPRNITARQLSQHGSSSIPAIRMGNTTLFVQRAGRKLRELVYVFEVDGFRAPDLSALAEHLTRPRLAPPLAVQRQPQPIVWARTSAGRLLSVTYDREQDTVAWAAHDGLQGQVEDVIVTPSVCGMCEEVWMIVRRERQGAVVRAIEFLGKLWEDGDGQAEAVYLDSAATGAVRIGLRANPEDPLAPISTPMLGGLAHLEGEEVAVWAGGGKHPPRVVEGGRIWLEGSSTIGQGLVGKLASAGKLYQSQVQTMPTEAGASDGSAQSKSKRIHRFGLWLQDTGELAVGSPKFKPDRVPLAKWSGSWGVAPPLVTGVLREEFDGDNEMLAQVNMQAEGAAPATVLSLMLQVVTEDGS